jgi:hypothetical protein
MRVGNSHPQLAPCPTRQYRAPRLRVLGDGRAAELAGRQGPVSRQQKNAQRADELTEVLSRFRRLENLRRKSATQKMNREGKCRYWHA